MFGVFFVCHFWEESKKSIRKNLGFPRFRVIFGKALRNNGRRAERSGASLNWLVSPFFSLEFSWFWVCPFWIFWAPFHRLWYRAFTEEQRDKLRIHTQAPPPSGSGACFLFCFHSSLILSHAGKHEIMRWFFLVWTWNVLGVGLEIRRIASGTEWSELLCAVLIFSAPFWIFSGARAYSTVNAKSENVESVFAS